MWQKTLLLSLILMGNSSLIEASSTKSYLVGKSVKVTKFPVDYHQSFLFKAKQDIKSEGKFVYQATSVYGNITREVIATSQNWVVPSTVTKAKILVIGGGGGGQTRAGTTSGGNGGGAGVIVEAEVTLVPGTSIPITIGSGGGADTNGGATSFGNSGDAYYITANGGTTGCGGSGSNAPTNNSCGDNGARAFSAKATQVGISMGGKGGYGGELATTSSKRLLGKCNGLNSFCMHNAGIVYLQSYGGRPNQGYFGYGGVGGSGGNINGARPTSGVGFGAGGAGVPNVNSGGGVYNNYYVNNVNATIGGGGEGGFVGAFDGDTSTIVSTAVSDSTRANASNYHRSYISDNKPMNGYFTANTGNTTAAATGTSGVIILEYVQ